VTARRAFGNSFLGLYRLSRRAWSKAFSLAASGGFAAFGAGSVLEPPVRLAGEACIEVGADVFVGTGCWLQVIEPARSEGRIALRIGDGTSIVGGCVFSAAHEIRIGRKVLIARNVYVADHQHAFGDADAAILDQGITRVAAIEIGDGAWLGENVFVGPGVRIGRGAVIGANAVVTSDVPDHAVAVGVPARVVKDAVAPPSS
jgi:lipopolysaccharide O-acetyltransferase